MAKKPTDPDLFKKLRENFLQMTDGFVDIGQRQMAAQAAIPAPSDLWKRLRAAIQNLDPLPIAPMTAAGYSCFVF